MKKIFGSSLIVACVSMLSGVVVAGDEHPKRSDVYQDRDYYYTYLTTLEDSSYLFKAIRRNDFGPAIFIVIKKQDITELLKKETDKFRIDALLAELKDAPIENQSLNPGETYYINGKKYQYEKLDQTSLKHHFRKTNGSFRDDGMKAFTPAALEQAMGTDNIVPDTSIIHHLPQYNNTDNTQNNGNSGPAGAAAAVDPATESNAIATAISHAGAGNGHFATHKKKYLTGGITALFLGLGAGVAYKLIFKPGSETSRLVQAHKNPLTRRSLSSDEKKHARSLNLLHDGLKFGALLGLSLGAVLAVLGRYGTRLS